MEKSPSSVSVDEIFIYDSDSCEELESANGDIEVLLHKKFVPSAASRPYVCEFCCLRFSTKAALAHHRAVHVSDHVEKQKPRNRQKKHRQDTTNSKFICNVCHASFVSPHMLWLHRRAHKFPRKPPPVTGHFDAELKAYICDRCDEAFHTQFILRHHKCGKIAEPEALQQPEVGSATATSVKDHVCELCSAHFPSNRTLEAHRHLHRYEHLNGSLSNVCDVCTRVFQSKGALMSHKRFRHAQLEKSQVNPKATPKARVHVGEQSPSTSGSKQPEGLNLSINKSELVHGPVSNVCDVCSRVFLNKGALIIHKRFRHTQQENDQGKPKAATSKAGRAHMGKLSTSSGSKQPEGLNLSINKSELVHGSVSNVCDVCSRVFLNKGALIIHKRFRHAQLENGNGQGNPKATTSKAARAHMGKLSTSFGSKQPDRLDLSINCELVYGSATNVCYICSRAFQNKAALISHLRSHKHQQVANNHVTVKPQSTPKTGMAHVGNRPSNSASKRPIKPVESSKPSSSATFGRDRMRKQPGSFADADVVVIKEPSGPVGSKIPRVTPSPPAETFKCSACPRVFSTKWLMIGHRLNHSAVNCARTLKCPAADCEWAFIYRPNLLHHVRKRHGSNAKLMEKVFPQPFACSLCDGSYSSYKSLRRHVRNVHDVTIPPMVAAAGKSEPKRKLKILLRGGAAENDNNGHDDAVEENEETDLPVKDNFACANCRCWFTDLNELEAHLEECKLLQHKTN